MTLKKTFTVELSCWSSASEADISDHIESLVKEMKNSLQNICDHSWNNRINVGWDESYKVENEIRITDKN